MVDFDVGKLLHENLSYNEAGAIFLSTSDGKLKSVNQLAAKLIDGIDPIDEFLPVDHQGLVTACLKTRLSLKRQCELDGLRLTWSYQVVDKLSSEIISEDITDYVCIYGQGFSVGTDCALDESICSLQPNKPIPNIRFSRSGELQFINSQTSILLDKLKLECIEDILPCNHMKLLQACIEAQVPISESRHIKGKAYDWIYESQADCEQINIYFSHASVFGFETEVFDIDGCKGAGLKISVDECNEIKFINYAVYKLMVESGASSINEILPSRHAGLIKACKTTRTLLTKKCNFPGKSIIWSYHPQQIGKLSSVFGYEI